MEDKHSRSEARKKALKELLEGAGMAVLGGVMLLLAGDFTFVEGVTTRNQGRSHIYLVVTAAALLIIGAVLFITGLVHLLRPGKGGGKP